MLSNRGSTETESILRKETQIVDEKIEAQPTANDVNSVLSTYSSEGDPDMYEGTYAALLQYVEASLDVYKTLVVQHELALLFYPVFVHMYLELVYNEHEEQGL
ncbi:TAF5 [Cordylochernes scorpioides]|uniref:TAF5 n=1 Tax=Cordylochernes scorpioides TaxID=51811 RepID=A0ABY6L4L0_9ARAC|nr:TAF5 [Cordylochernes scorpioides]